MAETIDQAGITVAPAPEGETPPAALLGPVTRIAPAAGWRALQFGQLWEYRELLYFLVWRDVKVRYKQTALGVGWVILQPLLTTILFTGIFGTLAHIPSNNLPYTLFALAGLVPWNYCAGAMTRGSLSLVSSAHLISKVYFPRLVVPGAAVLAGLIDLGIGLVILLALALVYGRVPGPAILALPGVLLLGVVTALGVSFWLAALNVRYRDVTYLLPFLTQFWMFATPVVYPASLIPAPWQALYGLNPMVGVVEGVRWAVLGAGPAPWLLLLESGVVGLLLLVSGALFFQRMEDTFADVI